MRSLSRRLRSPESSKSWTLGPWPRSCHPLQPSESRPTAGRFSPRLTRWGFGSYITVRGPAGLAYLPPRVSSHLAKDRLLDRSALAIQSLLGWQIGLRTPFAEVSKLPPGRILTAQEGRTELLAAAAAVGPQCKPDQPHVEAAKLLRKYVTAFLDEHPDAVLQLTGGIDSRILLACVPRAKRSRLEVMTLAIPGSPDAQIASEIAARFGMTHRITTLDGIEDMSPGEAYAECSLAAERLDCSSDPLAFAALSFAELKLEQRPRLSGLGGEVARGFYYFGPVRSVPVTRRRVAKLAAWRMFANESVAASVLQPDFARWARETATEEIYQIFRNSGRDWFSATDDFYLAQRMHRWAGVTTTASCFDRVVVNPMLDDRFLGLVAQLPPSAKKSSSILEPANGRTGS